jgi:Stress responsive A/B Barrel Domain
MKFFKPKTFSFAILVAALLFCAHLQAETISTGRVQHIVICWLKHPGNSQERERLIAASREFSAIPGVISIEAGQVLKSSRPMVDSSFDVAVVMTFIDEAALRAYEQHSIHLKAVQETLLPLVEKILVYDFVE